MAEDAGGFRFRLEQVAEGESGVVVNGYGYQGFLDHRDLAPDC
jgi:hypothetical protein